MAKTILNFLNRTPPFWVYALARPRKAGQLRRYTLFEISSRSGLSFRTVTRISAKLSWSGVKIEQADAFFRACNVDPWHLHRQKEFVRSVMLGGGSFSHLTKKQISTLNRNVQRLAMIKASSAH